MTASATLENYTTLTDVTMQPLLSKCLSIIQSAFAGSNNLDWPTVPRIQKRLSSLLVRQFCEDSEPGSYTVLPSQR